MENMELRAQALLAQMLQYPFPWQEVLREQVRASQRTYEDLGDLFAIHFQVAQDAPRFPRRLPTVPLSWQIATRDGPAVCQLFVQGDTIEQLEVVELAGQRLGWEEVLTAPTGPEILYGDEDILPLLNGDGVKIEKILLREDDVTLMVEGGSVTCEHCCIRSLTAPFRGTLRAWTDNGRHHIHSPGGWDLDCGFWWVHKALTLG